MMCGGMWYTNVVLLLMVDVRIGALLDKDIPSHRCYSSLRNGTTHEVAAAVACPEDAPHCATFATLPNLTSVLTCSKEPADVDRPCSLTRSLQGLTLTCVCAEPLCNAPFTADLVESLRNYSAVNLTSNATELFDTFLRYTMYANVSNTYLYKMLTAAVVLPSSGTQPRGLSAPHAEALKHEATAPSDDDEDEGEGSGSYEDPRLRRPPSAPSQPSPFLPANDNNASVLSPLLINLLITMPLFLHTM